MPSSRPRLDRLGSRFRLTAFDAGPLELASHRQHVEAAGAHLPSSRPPAPSRDLDDVPRRTRTRADMQRWFDSLRGTPAVANRALPVPSVMTTAAELWNLRPQDSNPCRNMRRYRTRERFLSGDVLKCLGFVLDHAEDRRVAAAIRLLLFTGARSSEIAGLRWDWIRDTRAVLPDTNTGPKTIQLPAPALAALRLMVRRPRGSRIARPSHPRLPPYMNLAGYHERRRPARGSKNATQRRRRTLHE